MAAGRPPAGVVGGTTYCRFCRRPTVGRFWSPWEGALGRWGLYPEKGTEFLRCLELVFSLVLGRIFLRSGAGGEELGGRGEGRVFRGKFR